MALVPCSVQYRLVGGLERSEIGASLFSWPLSVMARTANTTTVARMPRITMTISSFDQRESLRIGPVVTARAAVGMEMLSVQARLIRIDLRRR